MDRIFPIIEWDGFHFGAVLTHWTQRDTVAGTVWRLVMDRGETLVVVPYQSPAAPAPKMHLVPRRIVPVLAGHNFGWTVGRVAGANVNLERHWEWIIAGRVQSNLNCWRAKQDLPAVAEFEQAKEQWRREREKRWREAGLLKEDLEAEQKKIRAVKDAPEIKSRKLKAAFDKWGQGRKKIRMELTEPQPPQSYEKAHKCIEAQRRKIEKDWRARIKQAKKARAAEIEAERLEEIREMLAGYGATRRGEKWLKELYSFIRDDVCGGNRMSPAIGDNALRRVAAKVKDLTGSDIAERVMESIPFVKAEMFNDAARQEILERVRFVAEFADGRKYLVESVETCIHCGRDAELFELVKPDEQEREIIEHKEEAARKEARMQIENLKSTVRDEHKTTRETINKLPPKKTKDRVNQTEAAEHIGKSTRTLRDWVNNGYVEEHRHKGKTRPWYYLHELDKAIEKYG